MFLTLRAMAGMCGRVAVASMATMAAVANTRVPTLPAVGESTNRHDAKSHRTCRE
jgi:exosome complex RNA-binding protein Rrp42 (RNase PH superfamily)